MVTPTDATLVSIGSSIQRALFSPDSKSILYRTTPGGMFREAAGGGTPTTLQTNGVFGLYSVSPDASAALFTSGFDAQGLLSDLKLTSAIQNDAVVTLNAAQTSGFMGPGFTADSRYALYGQGIDPTYFVGSMYAVSVGGGALRQVAAGVDVWYSIAAAKLVFNDHFTPGGAQGTADIEALDLDVVGATPKLLATQANGIFLLTSDNHAVLYAAENGSHGAGIYRLALP